jgi:hypothetical protein
MAWSWRLEKGDGRVVSGPADLPLETFTTQADAETWIGEHWRTLAAAGIDQATLLEDEVAKAVPLPLVPA